EFEVERVQLRRPRGQHIGDRNGIEGQRVGVIDGLVEVGCAGAAEGEHALLELRANRIAHVGREYVRQLVQVYWALRLIKVEERVVAQRRVLRRSGFELDEDIAQY